MQKDKRLTGHYGDEAILTDASGNFKYKAELTGCGQALSVLNQDGSELVAIPVARPGYLTSADCDLAEQAINGILLSQRKQEQQEHVAKQAVQTA